MASLWLPGQAERWSSDYLDHSGGRKATLDQLEQGADFSHPSSQGRAPSSVEFFFCKSR